MKAAVVDADVTLDAGLGRGYAVYVQVYRATIDGRSCFLQQLFSSSRWSGSDGRQTARRPGRASGRPETRPGPP